MVDDLVCALSDKRVVDILANVIKQKMQPLFLTITTLQEENKLIKDNVQELERGLLDASDQIDALENYNRLDNRLLLLDNH